MWVHPTVTASTMITQISSGHKVRCHKGVVDFAGCIGQTLTSRGLAAHLRRIAKGWAASVRRVPARIGHRS